MDVLTPFAQLPNGTKLYSVRGQRFEVSKGYSLKKLVGAGSYGIVCSALVDDDDNNNSSGDDHNTATYTTTTSTGSSSSSSRDAAGHDTKPRKCVAIKKIARVFDDVRESKCVLREMEILVTVKHPNLIRLHHFFLPVSRQTFEDVYLVMDLYDTDLHRIIKSQQKLTQEHYQYFMIQAFRGLHYLHSANIMHRDLKPSNLLVNADCALAICDFGLARDSAHGATTAAQAAATASPSSTAAAAAATAPTAPVADLTQYVVTRWYRPPEVLGMGQNQYTCAVDVWSLGLIFAELLMGRALLPGSDYIAQLMLIVNLLGTPSVEDMQFLSPDARNFLLAQPTRVARSFRELFPMSTPEAADLLSKLLVFHPAKRLTTRQVIEHPYFHQFRDPALEREAEHVFVWRHADDCTTAQLRERFWHILAAHCTRNAT